MSFSKVFNNIKTYINNKRDFNKLLKEQRIATLRRYLRNKVYRNIFNNFISIRNLSSKKPNY